MWRENVQQWCPNVEAIVVLTVKGNVTGNLIEGEVLDCNNYNCKASPSKSFCWLRRRILTSLW
ncbi:MAG: hypothetical protein ACUVUF_06990 [Candidatus Bathycorpusculaceae bacterium]